MEYPVNEDAFVEIWMEIVQGGGAEEKQWARETVRAINRAYFKGYEDAKIEYV